MRRILFGGIFLLALASVPLCGQVQPSQVVPVPIPGGDILPPVGLVNQFFPGVGSIYDDMNAEPHGITNFRGITAMGYTAGLATDNSSKTYQVITDIRVYQGDYVGAQPTFGAGGSTSAKAHGTFVEIWIDFWLPSSGTPTQQVHDFNPGIASNGLFWILQVPDDAVKITDDTLTISLANLPVVDQFKFPGGAGNNLGTAGVPATVSFNITYTKMGSPRHIRPTSSDPLSPLNWAGKMWMATNSGTFSLSNDDGSFSAQGSFSSSGNFGELGTERNGSFLREDDEIDKADTEALPLVQNQNPSTVPKPSETNKLEENTPKLKGRLPVKALIHEP